MRSDSIRQVRLGPDDSRRTSLGAGRGRHGRVDGRSAAADRIELPNLTPAATGLDDVARKERSSARLMLAAAVLGLTMFVPTTVIYLIQANLGQINAVVHTTQIEWVQTSVTVAAAVTAMPFGKFGDIYGKRLVLLVQCGAAVVGAVVCASSHALVLLLLGRVIQGFAIGLPVQVYGLARDIFPRRWIPYVIALTTPALALVPALVLVGAKLTANHDYTVLFWALAVQAALAGVLVWIFVPETPLRTREQLDWPGIGLVAAAAFSLVYGLNEVSVPGRGWGSPWTVGFLAVGVVTGIAWLFYLGSGDQSLIDRRVLLGGAFRPILLITVPMGVVMLMPQALGFLVGQTPSALPFGLTTGYGLGLSSTESGTLFLIAGLIALGVPFLAAHYCRLRGMQLPLAAGIVLSVAGAIMVAYYATDRLTLVIASVIYEAGAATATGVAPLLLMQTLPAHYQGIGGGTFTVLDSLGVSLGSQFLAAITAQNVLISDPVSNTVITTAHGLHILALIPAGAAVLVLVGIVAMPRLGRAQGGALPHAAEQRQLRAGLSAVRR